MKVLFAVFALAVVVIAEPAKPLLAETFEAQATIYLTDKRTNTKIQGDAYWAVDQVKGRSVKKISFEGHPENSRHKVAVFAENAKYKIKGTQPCKVEEAGVTMPVVWTWLRDETTFSSNFELGLNSYAMFQGQHKNKHVAVAVNSQGLPVYYRKEGHSFTVEMHFTHYAEKQADESVFTIPEGCPAFKGPAVEQGVTEEIQLEMMSNSNSTEAAPNGNLGAVIDKAKEIGTCGCPYVWGGNGPCCYGQKSGYDCSGMTHRAYAAGNFNIPRVAADQQRSGRACSGGEQAGDLLFFGNPAYHVVMALGGGKIAECPDVGQNCRITNIRSYNGGCRRIA
jgi:hypothetical protein